MSETFYAKLALIVLSSIAVRWSIAKHDYSGYNKPPMFGDFEAQRHWMEITVNLPPHQWYTNTTENDLLYWGLDYPPLTAYHSFLCGLLAKWINPDWVALNTSRGLQTYHHKLFMRYTVLFADLLTYIPACILVFISQYSYSENDKLKGIVVLLLLPGLALIDYGHFQYNGVSLGLTLMATWALGIKWDLLGAVLFCLALNYKQMELYHALPFFCYLLGSCFQLGTARGSIKLMMLAMVVLISFGFCWLPFLSSIEAVHSVLVRLFPFNRGLYEDKVANFWCTLSVLIKLKAILTVENLVFLCLGSTVLLLLPSSVHLLVKPSIKRFKLALINSSLVFFLFSFHVHEKSILLALVPSCLQVVDQPLAISWFISISSLSMLPLLVKDGLLIPAIATTVLSMELIRLFFTPLHGKPFVLKLLYTASLIGSCLLAVVSQTLTPPPHLPDLYTVMIAAYCFAHFAVFLVYFHYLQLTS
ncbi:dolichyl pyrophosphate Man9GlcNAc2 alpha-1,3-glucosyltransferase-like [Pomacea canaliculata]|uniref:dolichyl pyrophosphate Man9GlcNAc2 alpha-1,3-glucosyltransferase-like n=1 Tax=Pomacea canaliculata TaxID=400727 RepID=UPI000D731135|nr:dolichyl pyrophosphate Man9GlcNAc2 alpha-1,3-glucosyltransferase-like [Pomacea canaliculata]